MDEPYLSLTEFAGLMHVSERTVRRWIKAGRLRAYKPGRDYRIPESAVRQFVEESELGPKAPRRSPFEPSLLNGLAEERRIDYAAFARAIDSFTAHWARALDDNRMPSHQEFADYLAAMRAIGPMVVVVSRAERQELGIRSNADRERSVLWPSVRRFVWVASHVAELAAAAEDEAATELLAHLQDLEAA